MKPDSSDTGRQIAGVAIVKAEKQALFWIAVLLVLGGLVYALSGILAPFIAGLAVAYFFDPVADRLEKAGFSRGLSAAIVVISFLALVIALAVTLYPLLQTQIMGLLARIPDLVEALRQLAGPFIERLNDGLDSSQADELRSAVKEYASGVLTWIGGLLKSLWSGGVAFFNLLSLVVITPLAAFYLLRDWDRLVARFDELLPRASAATIREQLHQIDDTVAAFVRGQATVCLLLGGFYAVALSIVGLDFGLRRHIAQIPVVAAHPPGNGKENGPVGVGSWRVSLADQRRCFGAARRVHAVAGGARAVEYLPAPLGGF